MTMFHIQYPASKTFLTWVELGCLCRALGFPADLFKDNFPTDVYEIKFDERGISVKTILRMFELNLMYKALHRTFNMHTADWNACVITRALYMLEHKVLDFEGVHSVRVAYMTYEHIDMKGMILDRHVLLRTLKMCGRTIAPLKLMHRIKHMKSDFEEKGRIQLYEFFNLIVWCDLYTAYNPDDMETSSGKEEDLFRLVDFERLLSHHDERLSNQMNKQYLMDEWDFGMECLGSKEMFKEPPVYTEGRIRQAQYHKQNYRHLKNEVGQSQKRLYRAHAGSIRSRPISAPDLEKYRHVDIDRGPMITSAQDAYETVQRRLQSAPPRASSTFIHHEKPTIIINEPYVRAQTPQVVTPRDLTDVQIKMENLNFDINTLGSRCQLQVENEMEFYIPKYLDKIANRKPVPEVLPEPEKKQRHWTSKIINSLAYPPKKSKPTHAKSCDARFRGWQKVNTRPGHHFVLTSQTYENSEKGRMFSKMEENLAAPFQGLRQEFVVRHTPKKVLSPRGKLAAKNKHGSQRQPLIRFRSLEKSNEKKTEDDEKEIEVQSPTKSLEFIQQKYLGGGQDSVLSAPSIKSQPPNSTKIPALATGQKGAVRQTYPRGLSAQQVQNTDMVKDELGLKPGVKVRPSDESHHDLHPDVHMKGHVDVDWPEDVPVPHMEHTGPKLVGVGLIGTISLLESIDESRDLEEKFIESPRKEEMPNDVFDTQSIKTIEDEEDNVFEKMDRTPHQSAGSRKSKSQPSSQQKRGILVQRQRTSQSAPLSSARSGSLSGKLTPRKAKRAAAPRSAGVRTKKVHQSTSDALDDDDSVENDEFFSQDGFMSQVSSPSLKGTANFQGFRGSVTSEETEKSEDNKGMKDDDQSCYSDEMTLASSLGMSELPESPIMRKSAKTDLRDSVDSKTFTGMRSRPVIHFEFMDDLNKTFDSASSHSQSDHGRLTSNSERKDSIKICHDYREYLSDSEIKKKTFSKETRNRLIGRVENAISPDFKLKLMSGDPAISVT